MLAREKEIGRARAGLRAREEALREEVGKSETELAQRERDARLRVEQSQKGLVRKTFMLKRRLAGRIKEVEAIVESHRAECDVRERRLLAREGNIREQNTNLVCGAASSGSIRRLSSTRVEGRPKGAVSLSFEQF